MSKIEIYKAKNGQTNIDVTFDKETIWLNQIKLLYYLTPTEHQLQSI
jgi:hypothetical protein